MMPNLDVGQLVTALQGQPVPTRHPHILIACVPKSGSTWLVNTLASLPGLGRVSVLPAIGGREHEVDLVHCLLHHGEGYVTKAHVRNSAYLTQLTAQLGLKPVVLVRNLFDTLVSLDDHLVYDPESHRVWSMAPVPNDYPERAPEARFRFLIRFFVPWYLSFVARWREHPSAVWVRYEALNTDPLGSVAEVVERLGLPFGPGEVEGALARADQTFTRKNVMELGRGQRIPAELREEIEDMAYDLDPKASFPELGVEAGPASRRWRRTG